MFVVFERTDGMPDCWCMLCGCGRRTNAIGDIDMVIHNGDISYADGEMSHWDVFMRKVEPIASRVPYQVGA